MAWKTLMTLSVSVTLATISMAPTAVFAQFPGPPAIGPGRSRPERGLGGPAPRLGAGAVPRGDLRGLAASRPARSAAGARYGYRAAHAAGATRLEPILVMPMAAGYG